MLLSVLILLAASGCASKKAAEQGEAPATADTLVSPDGEMPGNGTLETDPDENAGLSADQSDGAAGTDQQTATPDSSPADSEDNLRQIAGLTPTNPVGPVPDDDMSPRPTYEQLLPCYVETEEGEEWLDRSQKRVYQSVCNTVAWFDGFFGDRRFDNAYRETFGRVSLSQFWDQYDGFDTRFRFRAKLALPALNDRTKLLIGRGDERELIEGQKQTPSDAIPSNFNQVQDDSFLFGLGYTKNRGLKRGFDLSVGVKLRVPPDPYVKAKFRRAWNFSESTLFRLSPVVYWKLEEGFGATLGGTLDHILTDTLVLRWQASGNISEDKEVEGVAWNNWFTLFQALADRKALSYAVFVIGETKAEVQTQNFGGELRYRRSVFRKWLFLDLVTSYSWPRFVLEEEREGNFGIGAGFEMFFGPVPDVQLR